MFYRVSDDIRVNPVGMFAELGGELERGFALRIRSDAARFSHIACRPTVVGSRKLFHAKTIWGDTNTFNWIARFISDRDSEVFGWHRNRQLVGIRYLSAEEFACERKRQ